MMIYIAIALLIAMMLLVVSDVIMRYFFNNPITGTFELTRLGMACLVFAVAYTAVKGQHVTVDLVMARQPKKVQAIFDSVTLFFGLALMVVITWRGFLESLFEKKNGFFASVQMPVPTYPFWWAYVLGCAVLCLVMITLILKSIRMAIKG